MYFSLVSGQSYKFRVRVHSALAGLPQGGFGTCSESVSEARLPFGWLSDAGEGQLTLGQQPELQRREGWQLP